jgi:hypothetical protein
LIKINLGIKDLEVKAILIIVKEFLRKINNQALKDIKQMKEYRSKKIIKIVIFLNKKV